MTGYTQHIIQRGANREACFFAEQDYQFYRQQPIAAVDKTQCAIHVHVLMNNHVHLLVTPTRAGGIAALMKWVAQRYTQYVNREYRRTGSI